MRGAAHIQNRRQYDSLQGLDLAERAKVIDKKQKSMNVHTTST